MSRIVVALALIGVWSTTRPTIAEGSPAFGQILAEAVSQDIRSELARAQTLYYSAQFKETVELLNDIERNASSSYQSPDSWIQVKLYLGLSYQAMKQEAEAKAKFVEVCKLDPKYALNPKDFPPKVLTLFESAKASCPQTAPAETSVVQSTAETSVVPTTENTSVVSPTADASIVQSTFIQGKEFYDQGQYSIASRFFNIVLSLDSKHELAREYVKLADQKLQITVQQSSVQTYMDWKTSFEAKDFEKAAAAYGNLRSSGSPWTTEAEAIYERVISGLASDWKTACASGDKTRSDTIRFEARRIDAGARVRPEIVSQMQQCPPENVADTTNTAGVSSAATTVASAVPEAARPLPGPLKPTPDAMKPAPDAVKLTPETVKPPSDTVQPTPEPVTSAPETVTPATSTAQPAPEPVKPAPDAVKSASNSVQPAPEPVGPSSDSASAPTSAPALAPGSCLQVEYPLAMARLKEMVSPRIPAVHRLLIPVEVQVSVHIDKTGKVTVNSMKSVNPLLHEPVRKALEEWKFIPAVVGDTTFCVDTEIPITLTP